MADLNDNFNQMLLLDNKTFINLTKAKALINEFKKLIKDTNLEATMEPQAWAVFYNDFNRKITEFNNVADAYYKRQEDYRTNTVFKVSQYLAEANDKITSFFKDLWNSFLSGLGIAPILVPLVYVSEAVIGVAILSYFVYKYEIETKTNYNDGLKVIADLSATNPQMAEKLLNGLNEQALKEASNPSFFSEIGTGAKWLLILIGGGIVLKLGYDSYNKNK